MTKRPDLRANAEDAERALFGAALFDGAIWPDVAQALTRDDLYLEKHRILFDVCGELHARGDAIDRITVAGSLNGRSDAIGGRPYLDHLLADVIDGRVVSWHWPSYAAAITDAALERRKARALLDASKALDTLDRAAWDEATAIIFGDKPTDAAQPSGLIEQFKHVSIALEPRAIVPHLIERHIPAKSLIIGYGRPGGFKTAYFMDCAFSIASGRDHLVTEPPAMAHGLKASQAPVLWFDADSGEDELLDRARAFGKARGLDLRDLPFHLVSFPTTPINAARGLADVITAIRHFDARFVVMDNLLRVAGVPDENSPLMDVAMSALRAVVAMTGATVLVIHHPTKNRIGGDVIDGDDLRGHSSILGAIDLALRVKRDGDTITIKATKTRRNLPATIAARFYFTHQADGETLDECRFYSCDAPTATAKTEKITKRREVIVTTLKAEPLTFNKLHDIVKGRRDELKDDLSTLIIDGAIEVADGPRNSKLYRLR